MSAKEEFIEIYRANVHREGADALLDYLENKSDFFTSPASARYHGAYVGGLCEHSVNVYHCLREYLARERVQELYGVEAPDESVAVSALLHDLCKIGCYKAGSRNVKGSDGKWTAVPTFYYEAFPVGRTAAWWARPCSSTPWPSPSRWPTWRPPIFWSARTGSPPPASTETRKKETIL